MQDKVRNRRWPALVVPAGGQMLENFSMSSTHGEGLSLERF